MSTESTIWDRIGAWAGVLAVLSLTIGYLIAQTMAADPRGADAIFARALLAERMKWEWVTFARLLGGTLLLWFMAALAGQLRAAEGYPGRLSSSVFGLGVVWSGVWLLSGLFNSTAIRLAADFDNASGARGAAVLAELTPPALTGAVVFALVAVTASIAVRSRVFSTRFSYATMTFAPVVGVLTVIEWFASGPLALVVGRAIVSLAMVWTASTSALVIGRSRG